MHLFRVLDGFAVDIYLSVLDLQGIARQADTTLHVVLPTVNGAYDHLSVHLRIGENLFAACIVIQVVNGTLLVTCQAVHVYLIGIYTLTGFVGDRVEIRLLVIGCHRITGREVEHDNVVQLHFPESRHALVFPLGPFYIRFAVQYRQRMLCQRHGQRRIRHTRAITHLAYIQEVAYQQGFL